MAEIPDSRSAFDGIICIGGEDWWYHNRGHFDFQIMRRLAADWPVLFVNSLGVRMPSAGEGRKFLAKIGRKLKSLGNGLVRVENKFWVFSPAAVPGASSSGGSVRPPVPIVALPIAGPRAIGQYPGATRIDPLGAEHETGLQIGRLHELWRRAEPCRLENFVVCNCNATAPVLLAEKGVGHQLVVCLVLETLPLVEADALIARLGRLLFQVLRSLIPGGGEYVFSVD